MEESFHYLLMASQSVLHKRLLANLRDTGLTIGQPKVLEYLAGHDGASQIEIARACHIEAATLTSVLNRMEEKALIERRTLHGNRRTFYIFLTPQGVELANQVIRMFEQLEAEAFAGVTAQQRESFLAVLEQVYHNLAERNG